MISSDDRSYWFGASDSYKIINPNHSTDTWQKWWKVKCGVETPDFRRGLASQQPYEQTEAEGINNERKGLFT